MSEPSSAEPEREGPSDATPDYTAPRRGGGVRRNALTAQSFVAVADVDPRVADALLGVLEDAGVAAYAEPVAGFRGAYLDVRVPSRPTDRLYVDNARRDVAEAVVAAELPGLVRDLEPVAADPDAAFAEIVAAWNAEPQTEVPPWPVVEDVSGDVEPSDRIRRRAPEPDADADDDVEPGYDEGHYVPPPPDPVPEANVVTRWAAVAVAAGLIMLVVLPLTGTQLSPTAQYVAVLAIVGGIGTLVWRMRDAPSADDGPDDGAVV